jgi:glycosyltransferase involved in cell wall biosynthesis
MKIHALSVVKNEVDIIEDTLRAAVSWADSIYVLDNGSHDGTWEAVQKLGRELPAVVPYKQDPRPLTSNSAVTYFANMVSAP